MLSADATVQAADSTRMERRTRFISFRILITCSCWELKDTKKFDSSVSAGTKIPVLGPSARSAAPGAQRPRGIAKGALCKEGLNRLWP